MRRRLSNMKFFLISFTLHLAAMIALLLLVEIPPKPPQLIEVQIQGGQKHKIDQDDIGRIIPKDPKGQKQKKSDDGYWGIGIEIKSGSVFTAQGMVPGWVITGVPHGYLAGLLPAYRMDTWLKIWDCKSAML